MSLRSRAPRLRRVAPWVVLGLLSPGCLIDDEDKCGPNQQLESDRCVCAEGTAYTAAGCVACGENEMASAAGCTCVAGFARTTPADPCTALPDDVQPPVGAGQPCTGPADCAGTEAIFCDLFVTQTCLVQDCNLVEDDCFPGTECCDLSAFGLPAVCVAAGACMQ